MASTEHVPSLESGSGSAGTVEVTSSDTSSEPERTHSSRRIQEVLFGVPPQSVSGNMRLKECLWKPTLPFPEMSPIPPTGPIYAVSYAFTGEEYARAYIDPVIGVRYIFVRGVSFLAYMAPPKGVTTVWHWFIHGYLCPVPSEVVEVLLAQLRQNRLVRPRGWGCLCADHYRIFFRLEDTIDEHVLGTGYLEEPLCPGSMVTMHDVCRGTLVEDIFRVIVCGHRFRSLNDSFAAMRWKSVVDSAGQAAYIVSFGEAYTVQWAWEMHAKVEDTDWFDRTNKVVHLVAGVLVAFPKLPPGTVSVILDTD